MTHIEFANNIRPEVSRAFTLIRENDVESVEIAWNTSEMTSASYAQSIRHKDLVFWNLDLQEITGYSNANEYIEINLNAIYDAWVTTPREW